MRVVDGMLSGTENPGRCPESAMDPRVAQDGMLPQESVRVLLLPKREDVRINQDKQTQLHGTSG